MFKVYYSNISAGHSFLIALDTEDEALQCHRDKPTSDPYVAKLYAEFDAYTVEAAKRRRG